MRHNKSFNHLGRKKGHRRALMANLSIALVTHKRISTTLAKAKALRSYLEPLITKTKNNTTHNRRVVFSYLQNKEAVAEMFDTIGPKVLDRPGGYLRIFKTGFRPGDSAEMAIIELVDFNETLLGTKDSKPGRKRTRRGGRAAATKQETSAAAAVATETVDEVVVDQDVTAEEEVIEEAADISTEEVTEDIADEAVAEEKKEADTSEVVDETPEAKKEESSEEETDETKESK